MEQASNRISAEKSFELIIEQLKLTLEIRRPLKHWEPEETKHHLKAIFQAILRIRAVLTELGFSIFLIRQEGKKAYLLAQSHNQSPQFFQST